MPANFNSDDAALAVQIMVDAAMDDISFTTRQQMDADVARASSEARSAVLQLINLHGLTKLGNAEIGDEDAANEIVKETRKYQADPVGYANAFADQSSTEETVVTPPPAPVSPSSSVASPSAFSFEAASAPSAIESPAGQIRLIKRPAEAVFTSLPATYRTQLIPTADWKTPKPVLPELKPHFAFDPHAVMVMALAMEQRKNVIATGDPGCGKTEFFRQYGARVGLPVHKIPMDGSLTRAEIIGSFRQIATPTGSATPFVHGMIPRLIQTPCIITLDEIDQADPDIMYMLHPVFEGEGLTIQEEGGLFIPRHEHCYIVATANSKGRGSENGLTHVRQEMSEATRDRFSYWLNFTFLKSDVEADTLHKDSGIDPAFANKLVQVANSIRQAYGNGTISQTCSYRQLLDVVPMFEHFRFRGDDVALALGMDVVMVGRASREDADGIREWIKQTVGVDLELIER